MSMETSTKIWFLVFSLVIGGLMVFWPEISETWASSANGIYSEGSVTAQLPVANTEEITGFRLGSMADIVPAVSVDNQRTRLASAGHIELAFTLRSARATQDYPSLRVVLFNGNQVVRTLVYSPAKYRHGEMLTEEAISIDIPIRPGENGCTVQPFYGAL